MFMQFLGGASEIGASCTLLEIAGRRFLIDVGLRPKVDGEESLPNLSFLTTPPDGIIITHAHIDHVGGLPVIHKYFPDVPILTSHPTAGLAKLMLVDSAYLQKIRPGAALYTKDDVMKTLKSVRVMEMGRWYHLTSDVAMCMVPAGHILGAVSLLFDTSEGNFVISGDISMSHQRTIPGFSAPKFRADALILESTYGDNIHPPRKEEEYRLVDSVTDVVLKGGIALVPSFALGRAQEVILTLRQAQLANEVPSYPIYVDGMVRAVSEVYDKQRSYLTPLLQQTSGHIFWQSGRVMKVKSSRRRKVMDKPCCIVASSGMLFGGPSVFYASHLVEDPRNAIFITGYTDEESPGRRLQNLRPGDYLTLDGEDYKVKCQVRKFGLSGHADSEELGQVIEHFDPRHIYLVHGEQGRMALGKKIPDRYEVHLPKNLEKIEFKPPRWSIGTPPYLLDMKKSKKLGISEAAKDVSPLAGDAPERLPKLGLHHQPLVDGGIIKEDVPSTFPCMYCNAPQKLVTVDLVKRKIRWRCPKCNHRFQQQNILNLRQKEVTRLSEEEQILLVDLVLVSLYLHEPALGKNWSDLLFKPEQWAFWVKEFYTEGQEIAAVG